MYRGRHSFVIFGVNHREDSNGKFIPNIITPLRSDNVIVTSLKTTLSRTTARKDKKILSNNFRQESRAIAKTTARCALYMSTFHVSSQSRSRVKLNRAFFVS